MTDFEAFQAWSHHDGRSVLWQAGIALPRSALSFSVPLPAPHSPLLLGGWVSPGRNLPGLLPQQSSLLSVLSLWGVVPALLSRPASLTLSFAVSCAPSGGRQSQQRWT